LKACLEDRPTSFDLSKLFNQKVRRRVYENLFTVAKVDIAKMIFSKNVCIIFTPKFVRI